MDADGRDNRRARARDLMPEFGDRSRRELAEAHRDLQRVAEKVIEFTDFAVLEGGRSEEEQTAAFETGRSTLPWPKSRHNTMPSLAIDVAPFPIDWDGRHAEKKFAFLAGAFFGVAHMMGIPLRWGGDWDGDGSMRDQSFHDLPHIELKDDPE